MSSHQEKRQKKQILWVAQDTPVDFFKFFQDQYMFQAASTSEAVSYFSQWQDFEAIIFDEQSIIDIDVGALESLLLKTPIIVLTQSSTSLTMSSILSAVSIFRIIMRSDLSPQFLLETLREASAEKELLFKKQNLKKEISQKNKYLESLTEGLEKIVEERTLHVEGFNKELSDKLTKERNLIRFIKDFSSLSTIEDCLLILRKELKKFHKISDPFLHYSFSENKNILFEFKQERFIKTETSKKLQIEAEISNQSFSQQIANHFGRPFGRLISFPMKMKLIEKSLNLESRLLLFFETSMNESEIDFFSDFLMERIHILSMTFDRILLQNILSEYSFRWEKTFDSLVDPIAIIDRDYNLVRSNKKFSRKLINKKCYQVFATLDRPCLDCPLSETVQTQKEQNSHVESHGRFYEVQSYPLIFNESSRVDHVIHQYNDITESKSLYLKMLQSEKMGAIGLLAGNIAHELNNPLTGIHSLAQVLQQETEDKNLISDLKEIEKATVRSQTIIKNLMDFAEGKSIGKVQISLDEIVNKTLPMLKTVLRYHRSSIDLKTSMEPVLVEPHLIQQVIFNLVNNACQAMKKDGEIRIESYSEKKSLVLKISDNGPGIPEEIQSKIFDAFFTTKKEGSGTGLGLSLSKNIVEKFGGVIRFESEKNKGTSFYIEFPKVNGV